MHMHELVGNSLCGIFFFLFCMAMEKFGSCVCIREKFWLY